MRSLILFLMILSWSFALGQPAGSAREQRMLYLLNLEREHNSLPPLVWDSHDAAAAQAHAALVLQHSELSHRYDGEPELAERLGTAGARFDTAAENLAVAENEEDAHAALMYSPGHRANILNSQYNAVGISLTERGNKLFVVQVFSHALPEYSDDDFRQSFLVAINHERKVHGLRPMAEHEDRFAHSFACSTDGDAGKMSLPGPSGTSSAVFTSSDPQQLPEGILHYVDAANLHWVSVGACFRPGPKYGYANFWVIVSFGS